MSDVVSFAEVYGQYVNMLPNRTLLQTGGSGALVNDGGFDAFGGVDDDGPGGVPDDLGFDAFGGVDDDGPGGVTDDGGFDAFGGIDDNGPAATPAASPGGGVH
ncbi:MAG: hypothetical protein ACRDTG_01025 [Pseudonocardiaceae bacterium]